MMPPSEREWTPEEMEEFFSVRDDSTGTASPFSFSNAQKSLMQSGAFPHPLTVARLAEMADSFKKQFPVLPPYYRVNRKTYEAVKRLHIPSPSEFVRSLASVELRIDETVPDGEAWPPGKLGKDIDDRTES
jgi:hypothetical protein